MGEFINVCSGVNLANMPITDAIDALLLNVPAAGKNETSIKDAINLAAETKAKYLYLDSGGYEIYKAFTAKEPKPIYFDRDRPLYINGHLNITPKHIYEVAKKIYPSVFISLDYPVKKCADVSQQELNYMLTMGFNIKCARETAFYVDKYINETGEDAKFYIALQCYNLSQMSDFLKNLENINYDGISIPKRTHTPTSLSLFLLHIYRKFREKKLPDIHLLGSTKFAYIAVLSYFARNYFNYVSLDATSWAYYSRVLLYVYPLDLRATDIGDEADLDKFEFMECDCPSCKHFDSINDLKVQHEDYKKIMLYSHNWSVINQAMREFYVHADTADSLNEYLLSIIDRSYGTRENEVAEIFRCLKIIELMKDKIDDDKFIENLSRMLAPNHAR
jgi:queuine/archaeosine tRNA-ribosyltransferase